MALQKKIYLSNTSGLGNRLESFILATIIEDYFGHQIILDWPEADCLHILGTKAGRIKPWERPFSLKLRDFDEAMLAKLGEQRIISMRSTYGPRQLQQRYTLSAANRLRPDPRIVQAIRQTLAPYANRPAVAVHLRQGDFSVARDEYDATATRHPAPPLWWYEHVMARYAAQFPDVYFVLGYSGERAALEKLKTQFDIVTLPSTFDYRALLPGHISDGHPVVDLFGLACCSTLIATPTSSFSHWAGNILGPTSHVVLPPPKMSIAHPQLGVAQLHGCEILTWREAAERGQGMNPIAVNEPLPAPIEAITGWL